MDSKIYVPTEFQELLARVKPSHNYLSPVIEALLNALESIQLLQKENPNLKGVINLLLTVDDSMEGESRLKMITIEDNGIGFNEENYFRFSRAFNKTKGFNNRGSGRFQLLHRFAQIKVSSQYIETGKWWSRSFNVDSTNFIYGHELTEKADESVTRTIIEMREPKLKTDDFNGLTIEALKTSLLEEFVLCFYLLKDRLPNISLRKCNMKGEIQETATIEQNDILQPFKETHEEVAYIRYGQNGDEHEWIASQNKKALLTLSHFEVPITSTIGNTISLCSKGVNVKRLSIPGLSKKSIIDGKKYLTVISGDALDANVNDPVDDFTFPTRKGIENGENYEQTEDGFILDYDDIRSKALEGTIKANPALKEAVTAFKSEVQGIVESYGISETVASSVKVSVGETEEKVVHKLFKAQAEENADRTMAIRKTFTEIKSLNPNSSDYRQTLIRKTEAILKLIPEQNKEELTRYIIHREMVIDVIRTAVNNELAIQQKVKGKRADNEGLIHNILFKKKSHSTDIANDLWFLNEEFSHFHGCSELPLNQITNDLGHPIFEDEIESEEVWEELKLSRQWKRPDILIFPEEGKLVVIELKAPEVDVSNYLNQIPKYCKLLASFSKPPFKIKQFYGFLIGENIAAIDIPDDYTQALYGNAWFRPHIPVRNIKTNEESGLYMEILTYSTLLKRAELRNKSFADRLDIRLPKLN